MTEAICEGPEVMDDGNIGKKKYLLQAVFVKTDPFYNNTPVCTISVTRES